MMEYWEREKSTGDLGTFWEQKMYKNCIKNVDNSLKLHYYISNPFVVRRWMVVAIGKGPARAGLFLW